MKLHLKKWDSIFYLNKIDLSLLDCDIQKIMKRNCYICGKEIKHYTCRQFYPDDIRDGLIIFDNLQCESSCYYYIYTGKHSYPNCKIFKYYWIYDNFFTFKNICNSDICNEIHGFWLGIQKPPNYYACFEKSKGLFLTIHYLKKKIKESENGTKKTERQFKKARYGRFENGTNKFRIEECFI